MKEPHGEGVAIGDKVLRRVIISPFFDFGPYGIWHCVSRMEPVHDVVDVYPQSVWIGGGWMNESYD